MEEFWIRLLALLVLLHQTASASDTTELIGVAGRAITFHIPETRGYVAFWSFGSEPIATVEFGDPPRFAFSKGKYETRFTVSESGRVLSISQLRTEDTGTYSVDIGGKISTFTLFVYRELTEPTVTCAAQDCLDSICLVSLSCSVPGDGFGNISYTWTGWGVLWEKRSAVLTVVDKSTWDKLEPLTCTARNAVSSRSVTVTTPGGLCPGTSSSNGVRIWVTVGVTVGVLVVISFGFLVFCKRRGYWPRRLVGKAAQLRFLSWLGRATRTVSTPRGGRGHHQDWPQTSSDHHRDQPQTSSDHHLDWPHTSSDHHWDWPRTSSDDHWDQPQTSSDRHRHRPQTSSDRHQDRPQTSSDRHQDRPQTSSDRHQDRPQTSSDHHQGRPRSGSDHRWDRPWTTYEHPQDWPWTSSVHRRNKSWTSSDQRQDQSRTSSDQRQHLTRTSLPHSMPAGTTWLEPDTQRPLLCREL